MSAGGVMSQWGCESHIVIVGQSQIKKSSQVIRLKGLVWVFSFFLPLVRNEMVCVSFRSTIQKCGRFCGCNVVLSLLKNTF